MAWAFVQEVEASSSASASSIASPSLTTTTGNLLACAAIVFVDAGCTFTDSQSNAHTPVDSLREASIAYRLSSDYAKNITGGVCSVTGTYGSAGADRGIYVLEISSLDTSIPLDAHHAVTDAGTNPSATATCTNTHQPGVLLSVGSDIQGGLYTTGTGMTQRTASIWGNTNSRAAVQYKSISTTAGQTSNFVNSVSDRGIQVAMLFAEPISSPTLARVDFSGFPKTPVRELIGSS